MIDALKATGLEVVVPVVKPFDEVAEMVHVEGWRHHEEFSAEVVAEVQEPIVIFRGALVRPGRVVMGAPPQEVIPERAPTSEVEESSESK